nr:CvpA family protein [Sedimentibacter sp.]
MNFIDIIIIIFIGLACIEGYKRGFIKTLFDTIGIIVAFFASKELYYIVEEFLLKHTKLFAKIHDFFEIKASGFTEILHNSSNDIANAFRESLNLPIELQHMISNIFSNSTSTTNVDTLSVFVDNISIIVIRSISFLITFLVIYILLILASNFINIMFKLPVLNLTNKLFGAITGALKAIIILYIAFALCSPIVGFVQDNTLVDGILKSESSKIFYDNNIILNYLSYKGFYEN